MLEINKIYKEDCLVGMQKIDDKSIDCIICDLPYGCTRNPYDVVIPFEPLWEQYNRIIKDNGAIILFAQGMFTAKLMLSNEKMWRYNLIWKKGDRTSGFLNAKKMPLRNHEDICVFYKKLPTYNPQFTQGQPLHSIGPGVHKITNNNYGNFNEDNSRAGCTEKYPKSVLNFDRPHPPIHPTQKPVELVKWLIKTYTNEDELVLDNCIGSGTTAVAALETKRNFIGFETQQEFIDMANSRIDNFINNRPFDVIPSK